MKITVQAERRIQAPAGRVYGSIADFRHHHPSILPPEFGDLVVEEGGYGAGTVLRFTLTLNGRAATTRVRVEEPDPGRVLTETEIGGRGVVTTFVVEGEPRGTSRVTIHTTWEASGVQGLVERLIAPRMLRRVYEEELKRLDAYARTLSRRTPRILSVARGVVVT